MRIVIINKHVQDIVGGSEIQTNIIANGLKNAGHSITYLAVNGRKDLYSANYDVTPVKESSQEIYSITLALFPDIVYWRSCRYVFPKFMKKFKKTGIPIVFAVSNKYDLVPTIAFNIYSKRIKSVKEFYHLVKQWYYIKKADGVSVLNPDYIDLAPNKLKIAILNAMENNTKSFCWSKPYCVWVSNFHDTKRPELYVTLAKKLEYIGVDFLMIGRSSTNYKWIISGENLPESFHYLGEKTVDEVNGILSLSLFHIHTCHPEGFGNVFIQAWLNKKPSISLGFDPGGFIEKQKIGFNANNDFDLFVEKVKEYIENEELRKQAGQRAYDFAIHNFTPEALAENVETFLLEVLESKK